MKLSACVKLSFSSGHMLTILEKGEYIHGHNYLIEVCFTKENPRPWVEDFSKLKNIVKKVIEKIDHKLLLPEKLCEKFSILKDHIVCLPIDETTCEELAIYIGREIENILKQEKPEIKLSKLKLCETDTSCIEIEFT